MMIMRGISIYLVLVSNQMEQGDHLYIDVFVRVLVMSMLITLKQYTKPMRGKGIYANLSSMKACYTLLIKLASRETN